MSILFGDFISNFIIPIFNRSNTTNGMLLFDVHTLLP